MIASYSLDVTLAAVIDHVVETVAERMQADGGPSGETKRTSSRSEWKESGMKLFLDTANFKEIEEINAWGVLDGVTTNPTLLAKEANGKKDYKQMLKEICAEVDGPVSAEVVSTDTDGMLARGARPRRRSPTTST